MLLQYVTDIAKDTELSDLSNDRRAFSQRSQRMSKNGDETAYQVGDDNLKS